MITINIPDMTCGHCRKVVTKAILDVDSSAELEFDIKARNVAVTSLVEVDEIVNAVEKTGYAVSRIGM